MSYTESAQAIADSITLATSYLTDEQADSVTNLYKEWAEGVLYHAEDKEKGIEADRRQCDGLLYTCIQTHTSQSDWRPPDVPALWKRTWTEEYPEWVQPTGAHDAYALGAKCSHLGKHWISTIDANVYEPSVFGWDEVTE